MEKYDLYLARLIKFSKALGISIKWKRLHEQEAWYDPSDHSVTIDDELDEEEEIATILHELGHAMDEYRAERLDQPRRLKAYAAWYEGKDTKSQRKMVVEEEKAAWKIGRLIAKHLRINLGKWYAREQKIAVKVYQEGQYE